MSDLPSLLRSNRKAVLAAFADRLQKAADRTVELPDDGGDSLLDAVVDLLETGQSRKGRAWVEAIPTQPDGSGDDYRAMLAQLASMENVLRFYVVKEAAQRKDILAALGRVSSAVDCLRRYGGEQRLCIRNGEGPLAGLRCHQHLRLTTLRRLAGHQPLQLPRRPDRRASRRSPGRW